MRLYGNVHVHRDQLDRSLITTMLERLANGRLVLIFPEGKRTKPPGLKPGNNGASDMMAKANVPLFYRRNSREVPALESNLATTEAPN